MSAVSAPVSSEIGVETVSSSVSIRLDARRLQRRDVRRQLRLVADRRGQDHRRAHLQRQLRLDADRQRVHLVADLVAAVQLALVEDAVLLEDLDRLRLDQLRNARPASS